VLQPKVEPHRLPDAIIEIEIDRRKHRFGAEA
jgi:hypothetical protein